VQHYKNFGWREKLLAVPLILGTGLLVINQRIGITDVVGLNPLAVALRSDLWLALCIVLCLFLAPHYIIRLPDNNFVARSVTLYLPGAYLLTILFATLLSSFRFNQAFDLFGVIDFLKTLLCICIGRIVLGLSTRNPELATWLVNMLIFASILNVLAGIFTSVTGMNHIVGFNEETSGDVEVGLGFISFGNRFQGLGTNPNMVAIQGSIALSFLLPKILDYVSRRKVKKSLLLIAYVLSLVSIILWTGVRAALIVVPMICIMSVWLRTKGGLKGQLMAIVMVLGVTFVIALAWIIAAVLGLTDTMLERVSDAEEGRTHLWIHYAGLLMENPFGLGMAFETIADTYSISIIDRVRLPPHNSVLQTGMYGGFIAIFLFLILVRRVFRYFMRYRKYVPTGAIPIRLQGTFIAWCMVLLNSMFGGQWSTDYNFVIITSLLLHQISTSVTGGLPGTDSSHESR
jgi:hypothetical protein